jgi:hypothetical protein
MKYAERLADKLSAEINKNVHYAAKGSVAWNALILPFINEAFEEAAKVASPHEPPCPHSCHCCEIATRIRALKG